jgi:hypothetical protein
MVGYWDPLLETSKTSKNGEKNFFFSKKNPGNFFLFCEKMAARSLASEFAWNDLQNTILKARSVGTPLRKNRERLPRMRVRRNEFKERHPNDFYIGENWTGLLKGDRTFYRFILKNLDLHEQMPPILDKMAADYAAARSRPAPDDFAENASRIRQERIEDMKFNIATMAEMEQDADARLLHVDDAEALEFRRECSERIREMKTLLCILERGGHDEADSGHQVE